MMKRLGLFLLLTVLFSSAYAHAQCPCDSLELSNGLTGNEIVEIVCPGGALGEGSEVFRSIEGVAITLSDFPHSDYIVDTNNVGDRSCEINSDGVLPETLQITDEQFLRCTISLVERCSLQSTENIPTLSEWGLIAMTGLLAAIGAVALRRKKSAA